MVVTTLPRNKYVCYNKSNASRTGTPFRPYLAEMFLLGKEAVRRRHATCSAAATTTVVQQRVASHLADRMDVTILFWISGPDQRGPIVPGTAAVGTVDSGTVGVINAMNYHDAPHHASNNTINNTNHW
jgi:hypothetical protein